MGRDQRYQPSLGEEAIIHSQAVVVVVDVVAEAEDKVVEDNLMGAEEETIFCLAFHNQPLLHGLGHNSWWSRIFSLKNTSLTKTDSFFFFFFLPIILGVLQNYLKFLLRIGILLLQLTSRVS